MFATVNRRTSSKTFLSCLPYLTALLWTISIRQWPTDRRHLPDDQHNYERQLACTIFSTPRPTLTYPTQLTKDWINRDIDQSSPCNIRVHIFEQLQLHQRSTPRLPWSCRLAVAKNFYTVESAPFDHTWLSTPLRCSNSDSTPMLDLTPFVIVIYLVLY